MIAEILSIGDELLKGQTINSNAAFIAQKLEEIGVQTTWITTVGDNERQIYQALETAKNRVDVIISTGGLGPTHDDVTKKVFAKFFDSELVLNEAVLSKLKLRFKQRKLEMPKCNEQQAYVPQKAKILKNEVGTAPGLLFEEDEKLFFVLPGVPAEMEWMVENEIIPRLKKKQNKVIVNRTIHTFGIPESQLFARLGGINEIEKFCKVAFLPKSGKVDVRLTAIGENLDVCRQKIRAAEQMVKEKAGEFIIGYDEEDLADLVVKRVADLKKSLFVVEAGTKGELINQLLTANKTANIQGHVLSSWKQIAGMAPQIGKIKRELTADEQMVLQFMQQRKDEDLFYSVLFDEASGKLLCYFISPKEVKFEEDSFPFALRGRNQRVTNQALYFLNKFLNNTDME